MTTTNFPVRRDQVEVNGTTLSYLTSGGPDGSTLLLLHGTFWSRVWQPILAELGEEVHCIALDLPVDSPAPRRLQRPNQPYGADERGHVRFLACSGG